MKTVFLGAFFLVISLFNFGANVAQARSLPGKLQIQQYDPRSSGLVDYYEGLRPDSLRILREAISRTNKSVYSRMYDALSSAAIVEGEQGNDGCDGNTEAYTYDGSDTIYVCHTSSVGYNIRTLLHETAHIIGYGDECDADYYSGMAEIDSGEGLTGEGGYDDQCSGNPR